MKKLLKLYITGLFAIFSVLKAPISLDNIPEAEKHAEQILSYVQMPPFINRSFKPISIKAQQEMSQKYQDNPELLCDVMHPMHVGHGIAWILHDCAKDLPGFEYY